MDFRSPARTGTGRRRIAVAINSNQEHRMLEKPRCKNLRRTSGNPKSSVDKISGFQKEFNVKFPRPASLGAGMSSRGLLKRAGPYSRRKSCRRLARMRKRKQEVKFKRRIGAGWRRAFVIYFVISPSTLTGRTPKGSERLPNRTKVPGPMLVSW